MIGAEPRFTPYVKDRPPWSVELLRIFCRHLSSVGELMVLGLPNSSHGPGEYLSIDWLIVPFNARALWELLAGWAAQSMDDSGGRQKPGRNASQSMVALLPPGGQSPQNTSECGIPDDRYNVHGSMYVVLERKSIVVR